MLESFVSRIILVTGASGTLGTKICEAFIDQGAIVWGVDIAPQPSQRLVHEQLNRKYFHFKLDVSNLESVQGFFASEFKLGGQIDTVINAVGVPGPRGKIDELELSGLADLFSVNVFSYFYFSSLSIEHLKFSPNPSIVNISSVAGRLPYPGRIAYSATKWAVRGMTQTMAQELGRFGIRVNSISPGPIKGQALESVIRTKALKRGVSVETITQEYLSQSSLSKLVDPQLVVDQVLFLSGSYGAGTTGQDIGIDCGTFILK